ncbi:hypothetical protein CH373_15710 [Leptospira perolatii]|uniref:Uncharacterized protein n=1 Tax=Leptospira perolatii TaxID=2023191 RepID=A0A2M9ZJE4_9LEPT|nr:hypothetical protein [Leptospira perolatii]PJZ68856.1 hypothetical protein CH360_14170 [Leptospira perolatii]PJZ72187.1 hypothetical protein CH373_15710 [Leptospira perolatii]
MFKEYVQYLAAQRRVGLIITTRTLLLLLSLYFLQLTLQTGGGATPIFILVLLSLGLLGSYLANGFTMRSKMDTEKPVTFKSYALFFFWLLVIILIFYVILFLFLSPVVQAAKVDLKKPLPANLETIYFLINFGTGLLFFTFLPVFIHRLTFLPDWKSFFQTSTSVDYLTVTWGTYLISFLPGFAIYILSVFPELANSAIGKILSFFTLLFLIIGDVFLHYPVFYLFRRNPSKPLA